MPVRVLVLAVAAAWLPSTLDAQVRVAPAKAAPGAWEQFALQVVNVTDTPLVAIRIDVPATILIAGIERRPEWPFVVDSLADGVQSIEWRGGWVALQELQEFRFLGRLRTDVDADVIHLPVSLERVGGAIEMWTGREGYPAPHIVIDRTLSFSSSGTAMLGVIGIVVGSMALVLALAALLRPARSPN